MSKTIEIKSIRLFSWQRVSNKRKYAELKEFRETKGLHLVPSAKFDVVCEVSGEPGLSSGDFLLWTTVDFLVAPVTQEYEKMETDQIGPNVTWDRFEYVVRDSEGNDVDLTGTHTEECHGWQSQ